MKPLAVFFALGTSIALVCVLALCLPGFDWLWSFKPSAREAFRAMGAWAVLLMSAVAVACGLASVGLWRRTLWGARLGLGILLVDLVGDLLNATLGHDPRAWIGVPVAGGLAFYLARMSVRLARTPAPSRRAK